MKPWLFTGSVLLNLVLLACLVWPRLDQDKQARPVASLSSTALPQRKTRSNPVLRKVVYQQPFSWAEVESADYATYIKRLREIQCPEKTIRNIVKADLAEAYLPRRQEIVRDPVASYWDLMVDSHLLEAVFDKKPEELKVLDHEMKEALVQLLGPEPRGDVIYLDPQAR
jgi:hypothetical protein